MLNHSLPLLCSADFLAEVLSLTQREMWRLRERGIIKRQVYDVYDLKQSIQRYTLHCRTNIQRQKPSSAPLDSSAPHSSVLAAVISNMAEKIKG